MDWPKILGVLACAASALYLILLVRKGMAEGRKQREYERKRDEFHNRH